MKESIDDNGDCDLVHVSGHLSYDHAIFSSSHFNPHIKQVPFVIQENMINWIMEQ